jgi:hypothetical protein
MRHKVVKRIREAFYIVACPSCRKKSMLTLKHSHLFDIEFKCICGHTAGVE